MQKDSFGFVSIECIVKPGSIIYHMHMGGMFRSIQWYTWKIGKSGLVEKGNYDMVNTG